MIQSARGGFLSKNIGYWGWGGMKVEVEVDGHVVSDGLGKGIW